MKPPPLLSGAALLFWGWQAQLLPVAVPAALALESARLVRVRWQFTQLDLDRVWNLCVALFLGGSIYAFLSSDNLSAVGELIRDNSISSRLATLNQSKRSLFQLLQWLPVMFLPIALVQAFSEQERFDLSTFSWWLRRKRRESSSDHQPTGRLNVGFPYFACCLFAASAGNRRGISFTAGFAALVVFALWSHRGRGFRFIAWPASLMLALSLGAGVQLGLLQAQKFFQRLDELLLARWGASRNFDANETQTRIGAVGRLKLSGRIVLRVDPHGSEPPPVLREASYNMFRAPSWNASKREFEQVTPQSDQSTWLLRTSDEPASLRATTIAGFLPRGAGVLALPNGVARVERLPAFGVATNLLGSVRVEDGPGFVRVEAVYGKDGTIDARPGKEDLEIPASEQSAVQQIAEQLKLSTLPDEDAVRVVNEFFARNFTYTTWQGRGRRPRRDRSALTRFLLEHRSGHCEYFATATALLLRAADIPTRYATGFSVQEKKGRQYVVRERHAHAWCLAWVNDRWEDIDTTPASWSAAEAERASIFEPIRDLVSRAWFEFSRWRWEHTEWKRYLLWLIVPLLAVAVARVLLQRQWKRAASTRSTERPRNWPGLDSEFFAVEKVLAEHGLGREPDETGSAWLARLEQVPALPNQGLRSLLKAHYRLRFGAEGLNSLEREAMRQAAATWLKQAPLVLSTLAKQSRRN